MNTIEARAHQDQFSALLREGWRAVPREMELAFAVLLMNGVDFDTVPEARRLLDSADDTWVFWLMSLASLGLGEVKIQLAEIEGMEGDEESE